MSAAVPEEDGRNAASGRRAGLVPIWARIRPWRKVSQIGALLVFAGLPFANARGWVTLSGNFLSFNLAGLPLADPLASAQALIGGWSFETRLLTGAGLALLLALVLGRVFCSWICPYGLLSEWVSGLRNRTKGGATRLMWIRFFLALAGLAAVTAALPFPGLNQFSMPGWYSRAVQMYAFYGITLRGALVFPALLVVEMAAGRRFWCRYVCPQSVLISLAAALPVGLRLHFNPRQCTCARDDRACTASCSLGLNPRKPDAAHRLECSNCGDCVDACRNRGKALSLCSRRSF